MKPRDVARAIRRLRGTTLLLFDSLDEHEFEVEALPGWSVFDVFAHLAASDRGAVLGSGLRDLLPAGSIPALEEANDRNLKRLRSADRLQLRRELDVWGRRLAAMITTVPNAVGKVRLRTIFGSAPLSLLGGLRLQDEWVHNYDIAVALGRQIPAMDSPLALLLAEANMHALAADPITKVTGVNGVVKIEAGALAPWRFDLARRTYGPKVTSISTALVRVDSPTLCLVAAQRYDWREQAAAGAIEVADDAESSAAAVLDELYFV